MAIDRDSLVALRDLIADTDLTLETTPDLPQNRTAHCRENLRAALALADDLLKQSRSRTNAAAILGRKRRKATTTRKLGPEHYRRMAGKPATARRVEGRERARRALFLALLLNLSVPDSPLLGAVAANPPKSVSPATPPHRDSGCLRL